MSDFECVKNERKSKVWQFFLLNKAERKAKCISCFHILIMRKDGSTCQLQSHLKSKHFKDYKNDENVSVSSGDNELQITKESILESDQIKETFKQPNVAIITSKKRKFVKCKYCSDNFYSKLKFQVHRNLCKVYHKFIGKCIEGFQCVICSFNDSDRDEMLKHVKNKHRNDRLYNGIDGENITHVTGNRIRIISRNENIVNSLPVETVTTNEDSKTTNESLDKANDTIDDSEDIVMKEGLIKGQFISE